MTLIGYTMMCEQAGPKQLVRDVALAEVNAELPVPASFDAASRTVREEAVPTQMPCGPDVQRHIAGIRAFETAGFTHIALVQVGGESQQQFISWAATELLPALRAS